MFTVNNLAEWLLFVGTLMTLSGLICSKSYIQDTNRRVMSLRGHLFNIFYFNNYLSTSKVSNNYPLAIMIMLVGGGVYAAITFYFLPNTPFLGGAIGSLQSILFGLTLSLVVSFFFIQAYYFLVRILLGTIPNPPTVKGLILPVLGIPPFLLVWYVSICIFSLLVLPFLLFHRGLRGEQGNVIATSGILLLIVGFMLRQAWLL